MFLRLNTGNSPAVFGRGDTLFEGRKPLVEFGGGLTAENTLAKHGLAETVNALLEFFVIAVDLTVQRGDLVVQFAVQRANCTGIFRRRCKV